ASNSVRLRFLTSHAAISLRSGDTASHVATFHEFGTFVNSPVLRSHERNGSRRCRSIIRATGLAPGSSNLTDPPGNATSFFSVAVEASIKNFTTEHCTKSDWPSDKNAISSEYRPMAGVTILTSASLAPAGRNRAGPGIRARSHRAADLSCDTEN